MGSYQRAMYEWPRRIADSAIYNMLCKILYGRFEWSNLPEDLTSEQLERFITNWSTDSFAVGYEDKKYGTVILPAYWANTNNIYYLPTEYLVTGYTFSRQVPVDDGIAFYDNSSRKSCLPVLYDTCIALIDTWNTLKLNVNQQKNPWIWAGNEDEAKTIKACIDSAEQYNGYLLVTRETGSLLKETGQPFKVQPDLHTKELMAHYTAVYNRFINYLGIDSSPIEKTERLNVQETISNNDIIAYNRDDAIRMRETAADEFNKRFGMNVNVKWKGGDVNGGFAPVPVSGYDEQNDLPR